MGENLVIVSVGLAYFVFGKASAELLFIFFYLTSLLYNLLRPRVFYLSDVIFPSLMLLCILVFFGCCCLPYFLFPEVFVNYFQFSSFVVNLLYEGGFYFFIFIFTYHMTVLAVKVLWPTPLDAYTNSTLHSGIYIIEYLFLLSTAA